MNKLRTAFAVVALLTLTACAALDVHKPVTFEERVAFVQSAVAEAQAGLKAQIVANAISKKDASNVDAQLDTAIEGLDIAITVKDTDPARAENRLEAARIIVGALKALTGAAK